MQITPTRPDPILPRWAGWVGISVLAAITVLARALTPSHVVKDADLVPVLVGTQGGHELVEKVRQHAPAPGDSVIEAVDWTASGILVSVHTTGPRVVVLLDAEGRSSITHARGDATVHLPLPADGASPPYTVTVLQPRGQGGLLDARAVRVASLDRGSYGPR